jgi:hypothetical protein
MNLPAHLAAEFPDLPIAPSLFHNWPVALRFELNVDLNTPPAFDPIATRASTLFHSAFATADVTWLLNVTYDEQSGRRNRNRLPHRHSNLFSLARKLGIAIPRPAGCSTRRELHRNGAPQGTTRTRWAEISPRRTDVHAIFRRIAQSDFPLGSGFAGDVFFYNQTRRLLLHMYDDRGLDVIASDAATLAPLYTTRDAWLLDDDRPHMDALFNETGAARTSQATPKT